MNMFARFDEHPAMTLQVIKETKRYGRTDTRTDGQRENSIPPTNKVCGGYNYVCPDLGPNCLQRLTAEVQHSGSVGRALDCGSKGC